MAAQENRYHAEKPGEHYLVGEILQKMLTSVVLLLEVWSYWTNILHYIYVHYNFIIIFFDLDEKKTKTSTYNNQTN